jgi:hypothetical protein
LLHEKEHCAALNLVEECRVIRCAFTHVSFDGNERAFLRDEQSSR